MFKKIIAVLILSLVLASCGGEDKIVEKEVVKIGTEKVIDFKTDIVRASIKKLDKEGQMLLIEFSKAQMKKDADKMAEAKENIRKHMKTIQDEMDNIEGENQEEINKKKLEIISKISLYTKIGF